MRVTCHLVGVVQMVRANPDRNFALGIFAYHLNRPTTNRFSHVNGKQPLNLTQLIAFKLLTDWLIDWLIGGLMDWWIHWLIDWLIDWLVDWWMDWLIDWLTDWLTDWLIDWLIDWLTDFFKWWLRCLKIKTKRHRIIYFTAGAWTFGRCIHWSEHRLYYPETANFGRWRMFKINK